MRFDHSVSGLSCRLWILCTVAFFNALCFSAIVPILYQIIKQYNGVSWHMGIVFALFACAQIIFTPLIGRLADIVGKKIVLLASLFGSSCSALIQAFAPSLEIFMIGRFVDGATWSTNALSQAMISLYTKEWEKTLWFARYHSMYGLWFIVWPLIPYMFSSQPLYVSFMFLSCVAIVLGLLIMICFDNDTNISYDQPLQWLFDSLLTLFHLKNVSPIIIIHGVIACVASMFQVAIQPYVTHTFEDGATLIPLIFIVWGIVNCLSAPFVTKISQYCSSSSLLIGTFVVRCLWYILLALVVDRWFFWILIVVFAYVNICSRSIVSHMIWRIAKRHNAWFIFGVTESVWWLWMLLWPLFYSAVMLFVELRYQSYALANKYAIPFLFMMLVSIGVCLYYMNSRLFLCRQKSS